MTVGTIVKTGWDTAQFGLLGYGLVEGVKQLKDPLIFSSFKVLDSGSAGGITAIHTLIDSVVHHVFENLLDGTLYHRSHYSISLQITRQSISILTTASIARLLKLTPSIATACSVILVSQIAFCLIAFVLNYHDATRYSSKVQVNFLGSDHLGSILKAAWDTVPSGALAYAGVEIVKRMKDPVIFSSFKAVDTINLVGVSVAYSLIDNVAFRVIEYIFNNKWYAAVPKHLNEVHSPRLQILRQSISVLSTSYLFTLAKLTPCMVTAASVILVSQGAYTCIAFLLRNYDHGRYDAFPVVRAPLSIGWGFSERY